MKKYILASIALIIISYSPELVTAQSPTEDLKEINTKRLHQHKAGMTILGGWAVGNMAAAGIGISTTSGTTRHFHEMNLAWNSVNIILAGFGYKKAASEDPSGFSLSETIMEYQNFQNILLFNAGLDIGYMAFGAFLRERGLRKNSIRSIGYGQSIILQGGFLFVFDLVFYALSRNQSVALIESISLGSSGASFSVRF